MEILGFLATLFLLTLASANADFNVENPQEVVLTGHYQAQWSHSNSDLPNKHHVQTRDITVRINKEIAPDAIKSFLLRHWDNTANNHEKNNDYAEVAAKVLKKTPIPRTSEVMEQLSQLLFAGDKKILGNIISVQDYEKRVSSVREVKDNLDSMKLNKFALFEKLTTQLTDLNYEIKYLGVQALNNILAPYISPDDPILSKIKKAVAKKFRRPLDLTVFDFIRLNKEKIEFIYPEYEHFFAAKYIINAAKHNPKKCKRLVETILSDSKYSKVAEHLESALTDPDVRNALKPALKKISRGSKRFSKVMDNALSLGFDNVAAAVVEGAKGSQVRKYFVNKNEASPKIASRGEYRFGMLSTMEETGNFERSGILFRKNMVNTIRALYTVDYKSSVNKWGRRVKSHKLNDKWLTEKWLDYFKKSFVTQSKPNIDLYNVMKRSMGVGSLSLDEMNQAMFKAVRHGGLRSDFIITYLRDCGAIPAKVSVEGETLVHAAIKNQNPDVLKYVVEDLKVPLVDRPGIKSILSTILDTNRFPSHSPPRFWEMMAYTIRHGRIDIPQLSVFDGYLQKFDLTAKEKKSLTYSALTETDTQKLAKSISKLRAINGEEKISTRLKNYRKNLVLSIVKPDSPDPLTMTEVVLKYRGLHRLNPVEQSVFEACMYYGFLYDMENNKELTFVQQERIIDGVLENIGTEADFRPVKQFLTALMVRGKFDRILINTVENTLTNYEAWKTSDRYRPNPLQQSSLRAVVSLTRAERYSKIARPSYKNIVLSLIKPKKIKSLSIYTTACDYLF